MSTFNDSINFFSSKNKSILRQENDNGGQAFYGYDVNRIFAERKLEL